MPYNSKQQAVDALVPGAKIVGEKPYVVKVANPRAGLANEPAQIDQVAGSTLSIQGADGTPDTITIKEVGNNDAVKGGVGYDVIEGPTKTPAKTSTPAGGLERLNTKGDVIPPTDTTTPTAYLRDPKAPPGTQPFKVEGDLKTDPSGWTPIPDPNDASGKKIIGLWDPVNNKVGASVQSAAGNKASDPSGWQPVYRTPGNAASGVMGQWDPINNELHAVTTTADGRQIVTTPTAIYSFNKDEPDPTKQLTKLSDVSKDSPFQVVTYPDGTVYRFDPNAGTLTNLPTGPSKQVTSNGTTYVLDEATGQYKLPPGVTKAATVNNSTTLKNLEWYDDQGNLIASHPNQNYQPTAVQVPPANASARLIAIADPDKPGQLKWVPNEGRITASDSLKQLATQLTGHVVSGDLSQDEAIALINAANNKITNDINAQTSARGAASDVLADVRGNATTGAGMLNQRVSSATGALNSMMSSMAGSNMQNLPAGTGAQLVRGLGSWVTGLGGGDATYDAAARMVQAADPKASGDPNVAQQATQALQQMFQEYQRQNGRPAPQVAATLAAQQSTQQGGMVAPPLVQPQPVIQPQPVASGQVAPPNQVPGQNYGNAIAYTGGVAPSQYGFTPAGGSSYTYPGPVPWVGATPRPLPPGTPIPFMAPVTA